ncbi:unnamed protein product [Blepharisma stoltei]|uniref:Uncharacterized protein n=1 Tax=Blepharisma stoltei TaxID=1481888 RepID=A0AAU9JWC4_9CILI|nr:unnamed protein product [Blepharisma stoltei]
MHIYKYLLNFHKNQIDWIKMNYGLYDAYQSQKGKFFAPSPPKKPSKSLLKKFNVISRNIDIHKELNTDKISNANHHKYRHRGTEIADSIIANLPCEKEIPNDSCSSVSSYRLKRESLTGVNTPVDKSTSPPIRLFIHLPSLKGSRPNTSLKSRNSIIEENSKDLENTNWEEKNKDNDDYDLIKNRGKAGYKNNFHKHTARSILSKQIPIIHYQLYKPFSSHFS